MFPPFPHPPSGLEELVAGFGMALIHPVKKIIQGVMPPKAVTYSNSSIGT
ncbi:Hypothetical protein DIP0356 [Corynebacterium diphtheriae]|uniref:Uncharacterized protein n=1 Tax=Corynebacterium diphtheriae (strain ATCC 700971 / NCTC 13129 / Biotype gravis) TaxID=257309 RepID=Q6NJP2_CORDI|nr:Hypothetical protein DIP0356 [Corynebacterium diphtheriae]